MATTNPAQQMADDIRALQSRVGDLQDRVRLNDALGAVSDLNTTVTGLPQRIAALRTRGYVFEKDMESQSQAMVASWALLYPNLQAQINQQTAMLIGSLRPIEMQMPQLSALVASPAAAGGLLGTVQSSVSMLEDKISAAEKTVSGMYDQFGDQVMHFTVHLDEIEYMVTQVSEATFQLLPTEAGIAAVKAVWCKVGKEQKSDPEGVLYLTDQRILFEQKEEIVTKKVLFVATEKQKVQQLQFECPVSMVEKTDASKQGLLKNEDHIELRFASGAPLEMARLLSGRMGRRGRVSSTVPKRRILTGIAPWRSTRQPLKRLNRRPPNVLPAGGIQPARPARPGQHHLPVLRFCYPSVI